MVKAGSMKACLAAQPGVEQVVSFHFPGDVLDIGAVGTAVHGYSAIALERSSICLLSDADSVRSALRTPDTLRWYLQLASAELVRAHQTSWLLNRMKAQTRLGRFLLELSRGFGERGYSATEFNLSMSRHDIGNYLGLTVETVSRVLSRFQQNGLLKVDHRQLTLLNISALAAEAGLSRPDRQSPDRSRDRALYPPDRIAKTRVAL